MRIATAISACLVALTSVGCAWQQAYLAGQGWQRNACNKLVEQTERERCLSSTAMSYDDYRRQMEGTEKD